MSDARSGIILNADDYGLSQGVTDGILLLAADGRLSSTSAMVTSNRWRQDARQLAPLRGSIAVGLHLNLTEGNPLGPMPRLAPDGTFPGQGMALKAALLRRLDRQEIASEVMRQLIRFEDEFGHAPDFIDGHHHVHVYPVIRDGFMDALRKHFPDGGPLVRDPGDDMRAIVRRRTAASKALFVAAMASALRRQARTAGFPLNAGFSGFSTFGSISYAEEFPRFLIGCGERHIIMCHPGLADADAGSDPIADRRQEEYAFLRDYPGLPGILWHPDRSATEGGFPW